MYRVINDQIYKLSEVDKSVIDTRVQNAIARIANLDNQLRVLLEQKQNVLAEIQDLKEILPIMYSDEAKQLGIN
ncbi:MAG: hypothetical protein K2K85_01255 [Clostridia bacterium]|nr:hypothetical protein [Clostridia bacterium]